MDLGFTLLLFPHCEIGGWIQGDLTGGDCDWGEISSFIHEEGAWLPWAQGDNVDEAMRLLDEKLASTCPTEEGKRDYASDVTEGYSEAYKLSHDYQYFWYSEAHDAGLFKVKPQSYK